MAKSDVFETNERQKTFYNTKRKNAATRVWYSLRNGILKDFRKKLGLEKQIQLLHIQWCSDLSNKKVLDLGCYEGNAMSIYLAQNSKQYVAIDLSEKGINHLKGRIKNIHNAEALAIDFLSEDFKEKDFDLIYAYGVLHHFKDTDLLIARLKEKLNDKGEIISNDPLKTSLPIKFIRSIYRPFQSDKDWEWPFSRKTYYKFEKEFVIKERRGMLGKAKWFFLLNFLPISQGKKDKLIQKWHNEDWQKSATSYSRLFNCMHVTMRMQKKP